jgi:hypothetical protein
MHPVRSALGTLKGEILARRAKAKNFCSKVLEANSEGFFYMPGRRILSHLQVVSGMAPHSISQSLQTIFYLQIWNESGNAEVNTTFSQLSAQPQ